MKICLFRVSTVPAKSLPCLLSSRLPFCLKALHCLWVSTVNGTCPRLRVSIGEASHIPQGNPQQAKCRQSPGLAREMTDLISNIIPSVLHTRVLYWNVLWLQFRVDTTRFSLAPTIIHTRQAKTRAWLFLYFPAYLASFYRHYPLFPPPTAAQVLQLRLNNFEWKLIIPCYSTE